MSTAHITITGYVQGVGFRQFIRNWARNHKVAGWARNLSNGAVESLLSGEKGSIENVIEKCKKGPFLAEVTDIHVVWEKEYISFEDFLIVKD